MRRAWGWHRRQDNADTMAQSAHPKSTHPTRRPAQNRQQRRASKRRHNLRTMDSCELRESIGQRHQAAKYIHHNSQHHHSCRMCGGWVRRNETTKRARRQRRTDASNNDHENMKDALFRVSGYW